MSNCCLMLALIGTDLSANQAHTAMATSRGTHMNAAFWYQTERVAPLSCSVWAAPSQPTIAKPISQGVKSWTNETPKLPIPACRPSAVPCNRFGKKYEVDGMKPENAPPPMPARKARAMNSQ